MVYRVFLSTLSKTEFTFYKIMEQVNRLYQESKQMMEKALEHLDVELTKLRAGKASVQVVEHIYVDYYGAMTPLGQVANISTPDAKTISIQPWEKSLIPIIEKAIMTSNIGLTPQNDGVLIRIFVPALTEERRKDLVKAAQSEGEKARVGIRNARKDIMSKLKQSEKDDKLSEDLVKDATAEIQKITDNFIALVDKKLQQKEKDIMTI